MEQPNPYQILGVAPNATAAEVEFAYKNKVKQYHPDAGNGGTPGHVSALTEARKLLTDQTRRERYDRTGVFEEAVGDNRETRAITQARIAIDSVLVACQNDGIALDKVDIVAQAIKGLQLGLSEAKKARAAALAGIREIREVGQRFRPKDPSKDNFFAKSFEARARGAEDLQAKNLDSMKEALRAIEILQEFEYDWDRPGKVEMPERGRTSFRKGPRVPDEDDLNARFGG